jgi:peptide/nickel transport system substrate-binding protein
VANVRPGDGRKPINRGVALGLPKRLQRQFLRRLALVAAVAFGVGGTGCAKVGASRPEPMDRPLRIGFPYEFKSLNTLANDGFLGATLNALVYDYLLRTGPDGRLVPDLASAVPTRANGGISPDGRTLTYHLRSGVRWQDGEPLTASDVAFTFRAIMNPNNRVGSRDPYSRLLSVRALDTTTVAVRLRAPDAALAGMFFTDDSNCAILPEHLLGREPELNDVPFDAKPVGTGPYRVVSWDRGSMLRLAANPAYFGGKPAIGTLELHFVPDSTVVLAQLQTGELDAVLAGDMALVQQYARLPAHIVSNVPYVGATFAAFNLERPLVGDVRVRRAIASAIDREALAQKVYHGAARAGDASRGIFSYDDDPNAPWPRFDPHAAAAELEAAGWHLAPDGFRHRAGATLALQTIFSNASTADRIKAVLVQRELASVGVQANLQAIGLTQFWLHAADGGQLALGKFDLALSGYSSDVDPDVSWLLACRERAPRGFNESRYCNPQVDAALARASRALDPAGRRAALWRVQELVATDVPFLPLLQYREIDVMPRDLRGFTPNGTLPFDSVAHWSWAN